MTRTHFLGLSLLVMVTACTQRMICPAYQSAFIYDKDVLKKKFSYFNEDSTPKIFTASTSKNRYLVAVPESYRKKNRSLQTIEMKPVYPVIADSLKLEKEANELMAERDIPDTTAQTPRVGLEPTDSAYAITKTKEKYNIEQDNYMWYFRNILVLPDVRAAMDEKKNKKDDESAPKSSPKKKKGLKGLLKKDKNDSSAVNGPPLENDSTTNATTPVKTKPKEKGGLFKKKDKATKTPTPEKKKADAKKEDEDDGF